MGSSPSYHSQKVKIPVPPVAYQSLHFFERLPEGSGNLKNRSRFRLHTFKNGSRRYGSRHNFFLHIVLITIPLRVIVMRQLAMSAVKHHYWFPSGLIIQVISNRIIRMLLSELCTSPQGCGSAFDFSGSESSYFSQCASGTAYSRFLNADPPASILCKNTPFQFKNKCGSSVAEPPLF